MDILQNQNMSAACALHSAAPLVRLLHEIAHEWSEPHQRKGRPIVAEVGRRALCDFEKSPCALFASPRALLHGLGAVMRLVPHSNMSGSVLFDDVETAAAANSPTAERLDVLVTSLEEAGASVESRQAACTFDACIVFVLAPRGPLPPTSWEHALDLVRNSLQPASNASSSAVGQFLFAEPSAAAKAPTSSVASAAAVAAEGSALARRARRSRVRAPSLPVHSAAVVWRVPKGCTTPMWDLSR